MTSERTDDTRLLDSREALRDNDRIGRRNFLRAVSGVSVTGLFAGCVADISGRSGDDYNDSFDEEGNPDYGDWFDDVDNYKGTIDARDEDSVDVAVGAEGGLAFDPASVLVESGTAVVWKWTGNGDYHNVSQVDGKFESELTGEEGHRFEREFDGSGVYRYACDPHQNAGMKGAIAVEE